MRLQHLPWVIFGLSLAWTAAPMLAEDADVPAKAETLLPTTWTVLVDSRAPKPQAGQVDGATLHALDDLEIHGPAANDVNLIRHFKSDGTWGFADRRLKLVSGKQAAVGFGSALDFELEGVANGEGPGGWFFLVGWKDNHGYIIYNVTLRKSGSPWMIAEIRDGQIVEETQREFQRFDWKGDQPLRLKVVNKVLSLQVGKTAVAKRLELPNYSAGEIAVGTYVTQYGPKPVVFQSLRVRSH